MTRAAAAVLSGLVLTTPAHADDIADTWTYTCDRGAIVIATYVDAPDNPLVVLALEGRQVALPVEGAYTEDAARYAAAPDAPSYVWATASLDARLSWRDGGQETLLMTCKTRL